MPDIFPISDLENYKAVLEKVAYGNPVYLTGRTTQGRERYEKNRTCRRYRT